jgi:hypothetical protein
MPTGGLITIGAKQTVPPGDIKAKIAVCLPYYNGMMHPVHFWGHHKEPKQQSILDGRNTLLWLNIDVELRATSKIRTARAGGLSTVTVMSFMPIERTISRG